MTTQNIALRFKTQDDAPNYTRAASPATSCSTCAHFQMRWCVECDFAADPAWTCDLWQKRPASSSAPWPSPVPPQEAFPIATTKEASIATFTTFKDKNGAWRWVLKSSNAFEDRDKEVVTTKALNRDVQRTDKTGEYGPLRWWHVGTPVWKNPLDWRSVVAGKGLDIGDCDFSAMEGPILIESGTFRSKAIGDAIAEKQAGLRASLGFSHPLDEPDGDGLFHHINRFERSLTPANKASNMRTGLVVTKERNMDPEKLTAFKAVVGEEIADQVLADAQGTTKEARAAGIREKAADTGVAALEDTLETLTAQIASFKAKVAAAKVTATNGQHPPVVAGAIVQKAPDAEMDDDEPDGDEDGGEGDGDGDEVYLGDMTGPEFVQLLHTALGPLFEQHTKALDVHGKMGALADSMKEMKGYLGGMAQKDDTVASLREQVAALGVSLKEATDVLEDLTGSVPRQLSRPLGTAYKASEGTDNVVPASHPMFQPEEQPTVQGPLSWIDSFVVHQQQPAPVQSAAVVQPGLNGRVG